MPTATGFYYFFSEGGDPSRPPVVLIHGAGCNHLYWPPELRRLSGYRVYTLDLPAHGKSEGMGRQSVSDYARGVIEFMDAAMLARAVIVGHSLGGAIALTLALDYPDRLTGLGLIATGARLPVASFLLENCANPTTFPQALQAIQAWSFGPQADPHLKEQAARRMAEIRPAVLHGDLKACDAFDVTNRLEKVRTPTLILCGTEDRMTPLQYSKTLANLIPDAALQTIDGAGHMVMLEQPRRVASLLSVFLMTVPYTPEM
jgi:pimeloyl-ACP methyl ester carboxylesterase